MATRIGGARRKTRDIMSKKPKDKGKVSITKTLQTFKKGDKVVFKAEPAVQKGIYTRRFHGKVGIVHAKRGECYEVKVQDGTVEKLAVVAPVHLKKVSA